MNYKDLDVWKDSIAFVKEIYKITSIFPGEEKYGLVSQIRRSSVSIPTNIAEGSARQSDRELIQFLHIAIGSAAELETLLYISFELEFLDQEKYNTTNQLLQKIKSKIVGLIKYLKNKK